MEATGKWNETLKKLTGVKRKDCAGASVKVYLEFRAVN
jgi:hypothetical protein